MNDDTTSAFMWEWFTTKPFRDGGEVKFVRIVFLSFFCWLSLYILANFRPLKTFCALRLVRFQLHGHLGS